MTSLEGREIQSKIWIGSAVKSDPSPSGLKAMKVAAPTTISGAVSPMARVIAPRFWAGVISMPVLSMLFSAMGVFGGYLIGVLVIGVDNGAFWGQMQAAVDFRYDVLNGLVKAIAFGFAVSIIATFQGYDAPPTAEGVSRATTRTVVTSALTILAIDLVLTAFMLRAQD